MAVPGWLQQQLEWISPDLPRRAGSVSDQLLASLLEIESFRRRRKIRVGEERLFVVVAVASSGVRRCCCSIGRDHRKCLCACSSPNAHTLRTSPRQPGIRAWRWVTEVERTAGLGGFLLEAAARCRQCLGRTGRRPRRCQARKPVCSSESFKKERKGRCFS